LTHVEPKFDNGDMSQRFESQFEASDKTEVFFQEWREPTENGVVLITHGLSEHSECYDHVAKAINEMGWSVVAWDLRGHGRSEGKRGFVRKFSEYIDDHKKMIEIVIKEKKEDAPLVLLGHSMGGLITLLTSLQLPTGTLQGLALSSPALGYAIKVPIWKDKFARVATKYFPSVTLHNELDYDDLTHDSEFLDSYPKDTLRHEKISPNIYLGMLEGFAEVFVNKDQIPGPIFFQIAGHDKIVDSLKSKQLFEELQISEKRLEIYAESYHEIYNDFERETCFKDLKNFLGSIK
jgi:alpha-beta hydrolase superfamily lysophospholipase